MPKFFDKLKDVLTSDAVIGSKEDRAKAKALLFGEVPYARKVRRFGGAVTPNVIERRIPQDLKDIGANLGPTGAFRQAADALALDHLIGLQVAQAALPKRLGNIPVVGAIPGAIPGVRSIPVEGIGAEVFRPSNLIPVSRVGSIPKGLAAIKAGGLKAGPPLYRRLAAEGALAGTFGGAETARLGGGPEDIITSAALSTGIGAAFPLGLEGIGSVLSNPLERVAGAELADVGPATVPKTRMSKMAPEERAKYTQPQTIDSFMARIDKNKKIRNDRIARNRARLKEPFTMRPEGKVGGEYLEDLLTVTDLEGVSRFYPLDIIRADAGEEVYRPVIRAGEYALPTAKEVRGKKVLKGAADERGKVSLSQQQAEVLTDLYDVNDKPTVTEVRNALQRVARGGLPKPVKRLDVTQASPAPGRHTLITEAGDKLEWRETPEGGHIVDVTAVTEGKGTGSALLDQAIGGIRRKNPKALITADLNSESGARLFAKQPGAEFTDRQGNPISAEDAIASAARGEGPEVTVNPVKVSAPEAKVSMAHARRVREFVETVAVREPVALQRPHPTTEAFRKSDRYIKNRMAEVMGHDNHMRELQAKMATTQKDILTPEGELVEYPSGVKSRSSYAGTRDSGRTNFTVGPYQVSAVPIGDDIEVVLTNVSNKPGKVADLRNVAALIGDLGESNDRLIVAHPTDERLTAVYKKAGFESTGEVDEITGLETLRFNPEEYAKSRASRKQDPKKVAEVNRLKEDYSHRLKLRTESLNNAARELRLDPQEVDAVATDMDALDKLIRQQLARDPIDALPVLPPTEAIRVLDNYTQKYQKVTDDLKASLKVDADAAARENELIEAVNTNLTNGRVPAGDNLNDAGINLRKWKESRAFRAANPRGVNKMAEGVESLANYANLRLIDAYRLGIGKGRPPRGSDPRILKEYQNRRMRQMLSDLREMLEGVGKEHEEGKRPLGRVFLDQPDGGRLYGKIDSISPIGTDYNEWLVDFRDPFQPARKIEQDIRVKDLKIEYRKGVRENPRTKQVEGFDDIEGRYAHERDIIRDAQSEEASRVVSDSPETLGEITGLAQLRQRQMAALNPLTTTQQDIRTIAQLDAEVQNSWDKFEATLMPLAPELKGSEYLNEGYVMMLNGEFPKTPSKGLNQAEAAQDMVKSYRDYWEDSTGMAYEDADYQPVVDNAGDPIPFAMQLLGRSAHIDELDPTIKNRLPYRVRRAMDTVAGLALRDNRLFNINKYFQYDGSGISQNIKFNNSGYTQEARRLALRYADEMQIGSVSKRPHAFRWSDGDLELAAIQRKHFKLPDPNDESLPPPFRAAVKAITDLPEGARAQAEDILSGELRFFFDYPGMFPGIPKEFAKLADDYQIYLQRTSLLPASRGKNISQGYLNRLMLDQSFRKQIPEEILTDGHPIEVLAAAARRAEEIGKPLKEFIASGEDLLDAEPLAYWRSWLDDRLAHQIASLSDEPIEMGVGRDISHQPGEWNIRSLDKYKVKNTDGSINKTATNDLQHSLKELEKILNADHQWGGLQRLSQSIGRVVLSADLNIVSVQGYAGVATRFMHELASGWKNPVTAPFIATAKTAQYLNNIREITSDENWFAWMRANGPELQQHAAHGLTIGEKGFVAGPRQNKMPLEDMGLLGKGQGVIPGAGRIPGKLTKGIRELNDLQFNRYLLYLKVTAVRSNLEQAKILKALGPTGGGGWAKGLPGMKAVVDENGGEGQFFFGENEKTYDAIIRTINNKFGGIDLNAQGIAQWRQAAEQIMTITPGFFRAQAGMMNTAITRPNTVEGWLATKGMAEEVLFAAMVATLIGTAVGAVEGVRDDGVSPGAAGKGALGGIKALNIFDMSKSDWMAIPFEDSYIQLIPRVGIPRLIARVVKEGVDAQETGEGFDIGPAVQTFVQSRFSPLVGATSPAILDEDFLGRRYTDNKDRAFASLTSFMPIFAQNLADDSKEQIARGGWGRVPPVLAQTPLQLLGKNMVPRPPIEKLDEIAKNYSSENTPKSVREWFDLTSQEQEDLKKDPQVKAAFEDFTFYQERRQSPKEQQIEAAFKVAEQRTNSLRNGKIKWRDGTRSSMADLYSLLQAGEIDGDEYRQKYQYVSGQISEVMHGMDTNLKRLDFNLDESHDKRVKRLKEVFGDADEKAIMTQLAVWDAEQIQPENYTESKNIQTPDGLVQITETDWDAYQKDKESIYTKYPANIQANARAFSNKWEDEGVDAYRDSSKLRTAIEEIPRYRGMTNEDADKIDAMTKSFRDISDVVRAKIGLPGSIAPLPPGMNKVLRAYVVRAFAQQGLLTTQQDLKLASLAIMMQEKPILRDYLRNPAQTSALLNHPEVLMFYPYLFSMVPTWMRGQLPQNLQPELNPSARYEQAVG